MLDIPVNINVQTRLLERWGVTALPQGINLVRNIEFDPESQTPDSPWNREVITPEFVAHKFEQTITAGKDYIKEQIQNNQTPTLLVPIIGATHLAVDLVSELQRDGVDLSQVNLRFANKLYDSTPKDQRPPGYYDRYDITDAYRFDGSDLVLCTEGDETTVVKGDVVMVDDIVDNVNTHNGIVHTLQDIMASEQGIVSSEGFKCHTFTPVIKAHSETEPYTTEIIDRMGYKWENTTTGELTQPVDEGKADIVFAGQLPAEWMLTGFCMNSSLANDLLDGTEENAYRAARVDALERLCSVCLAGNPREDWNGYEDLLVKSSVIPDVESSEIFNTMVRMKVQANEFGAMEEGVGVTEVSKEKRAQMFQELIGNFGNLVNEATRRRAA